MPPDQELDGDQVEESRDEQEGEKVHRPIFAVIDVGLHATGEAQEHARDTDGPSDGIVLLEALRGEFDELSLAPAFRALNGESVDGVDRVAANWAGLGLV